MDFDPVIPYENTFDALYGLHVVESGDERVVATVAVRDAIKQPMGLVHGGVFASIAESITSMATAQAVIPDGNMAQGLSNQTSFLRPITGGSVHALARRRHRGRTTWVWEVEIADDEQRLVEAFRAQLDAGMWAAVPQQSPAGRREAQMVTAFEDIPRDAERVIFFPRAAGG